MRALIKEIPDLSEYNSGNTLLEFHSENSNILIEVQRMSEFLDMFVVNDVHSRDTVFTIVEILDQKLQVVIRISVIGNICRYEFHVPRYPELC